jgi:hypothetical protein
MMEEMKSLTHVTALTPIKHTGYVLLLLSLLTLLALLAAGAGLLHPVSSPFGHQRAAATGDVPIGSTAQVCMSLGGGQGAASNGEILIGTTAQVCMSPEGRDVAQASTGRVAHSATLIKEEIRKKDGIDV